MRHRSSRVAAALAALSLGLTTACAATNPNQPGAGPSGDGAAAFPVTVGTLTLQKRPERIVSLSPTLTEMLFAIGAGKQVVAADEFSNYPADAPKTALSGFKPNAEAIANYQPDLVVLSDDPEKIVSTLTTLKIPVYQGRAARNILDTSLQLADLGTLTGHPTEAVDVNRRLKDDLDKLVKDQPQRSKPLTYYYELDQSLFSVTSKTFIGALFTMVGLQNIADPADTSGSGYAQMNPESVIAANPDLIFLADTKCCQQSADTVRARAGWAGITAVKNNQVVLLDDDIASRWGPRIVDLLRAIVEAVAKVPA